MPVATEPTLAGELPRFLAYLAHVRGRAPNTVRAYRSDLRQASAALPAPLTTLDHPAVEQWLASAPSAATRQRWRAALAAVCHWALREELITRALVQITAPDVNQPRPIPVADLRLLDGAIGSAPQPYLLLLTLLHETGMRAGEVVGSNADDVTIEPGREGLRITSTVDRTVVLTADAMPRTMRALRAWQKTAGPAHTPLAVSNRGTRVTYDALEYQWQKLAWQPRSSIRRARRATRCTNCATRWPPR